MDVAALIAWAVTATGGFYLFGTWLSAGGMSGGGSRSSRFSPVLILGHAGLAAAGLVVWIAYLTVDDADVLAWIALGVLVPVALLGFTMFLRWLGDRRDSGVDSQLAEQRFPSIVVAAHGLLAVTTVALVLFAAVDGAS